MRCFIGRITSSRALSCDSVIDGAFFSHPDFQVPEEEMRQHTCEYVVMPPRKLTNLIVVHTQFGFGFLETLLDRPAQAAEPNQRLQSCTRRCVADEKAVYRFLAQGPTNQQPDGFLGQSGRRQDDAPPGELIDNGPLGAFGDCPAIPEIIVDTFGQVLHSQRLAVRISQNSAGPCFPAPRIGTGDCLRSFELALQIFRNRNEISFIRHGVYRVNKLWTDAVQRIGPHELEWQDIFLADLGEHFGGQLRFGLENRVIWQLALIATLQILIREPFLGHEQTLVDQCVAVFRNVTGKDAHLARVDFAYRAAVLLGDANGILTLFNKTALIKNQRAA